MMNIISLADRLNDNRMISVEQMLEIALEDVRKGELPGTKAILIVLDQGPNQDCYDLRFRASGTKASEIVALLTVGVARFVDMVRGR